VLKIKYYSAQVWNFVLTVVSSGSVPMLCDNKLDLLMLTKTAKVCKKLFTGRVNPSPIVWNRLTYSGNFQHVSPEASMIKRRSLLHRLLSASLICTAHVYTSER
jgi:hypothetical protein